MLWLLYGSHTYNAGYFIANKYSVSFTSLITLLFTKALQLNTISDINTEQKVKRLEQVATATHCNLKLARGLGSRSELSLRAP